MSSTLTLELDSALASDLERLALQDKTSVADLAAGVLKELVLQRDREARIRETALGYLNKDFRSSDGQPLTRDEVYNRGAVH